MMLDINSAEESGVVEKQPAQSHRKGLTDVSVIDWVRENVCSFWPEWATLILYTSIVAYAIPYHEPWADEAQSWQLARSLPLLTLFKQYVRYEGSPGLWHFLLWILHKAHVSYGGIHWIAGAIAVAGISVLILTSPFPRYLRLSLPFTYFLLFQYAVVARNYVLVPSLLFMIAFWWKRRPFVIALLLGLLANVALHAAVISGGLAIVYTIEQVRDVNTKDAFRRRKLWVSVAILLALYIFALLTAWPPHDLALSRVRGQSRPFTEYAIASVVSGVCQPWLLSILFWIAIVICLGSRRRLYYLLPVVFFAGLSGAVYANWWHVGLLIPLVICLLWITWPTSDRSISRYEILGRAAMILMVATQILWSAYAVAYDHSNAYSPDLAAFRFLRPLIRDGATIAVTYLDQPDGNQAYDSVGLLPYFDHSPFINQPSSFWSWSANNPTEALFFVALRSHPPIVLVENRQHQHGQPINLQAPKIKSLTKAGYRLTNVFCGARPERLGVGGSTCHLIFAYTNSAQEPTAPNYRSRTNAPPSR